MSSGCPPAGAATVSAVATVLVGDTVNARAAGADVTAGSLHRRERPAGILVPNVGAALLAALPLHGAGSGRCDPGGRSLSGAGSFRVKGDWKARRLVNGCNL
jgi:hypothetical protein